MSTRSRILFAFISVAILVGSFWATLKVLDSLEGSPAHTTKPRPSVTWDDPRIWHDPALLVQEHGIEEINAEASKALGQQRAAEIVDAMVWVSDGYPDEAGIAYHAAVALSWTGRDADSLKYFDRSLARNPNSFYAQLNKGAALDRLGRSDDACRAFRTAYDVDPKLGRDVEARLKSCKG
jgi:tetratricopeptide (TPR) repeat protein